MSKYHVRSSCNMQNELDKMTDFVLEKNYDALCYYHINLFLIAQASQKTAPAGNALPQKPQ